MIAFQVVSILRHLKLEDLQCTCTCVYGLYRVYSLSTGHLIDNILERGNLQEVGVPLNLVFLTRNTKPQSHSRG